MHFISAGFYHNIFSRCKELSDWRKPHTKRNFRRQTAQLEIYSRGLLVYFFFFFALLRSALLFGRWVGGILNINVQLMITDILSIFLKSIYI